MDKIEYQKIVKRNMPKNPKLINSILAFLVGGLVGVGAELFAFFIRLSFNISQIDSHIWTGLVVVFVTALLTSFGVFDNAVSKYKAGLIIPTTGFAHAIMSSILDYRRDGLITGIGSNCFKLAGSVILFGVVVSFIMAFVWGLIYG